MDLVNLEVNRVVLHEVFKRQDDKQKTPPEYGVAIETLGDQALEALKARIWAAMSNSSRCVQMDIEKTDLASMV